MTIADRWLLPDGIEELLPEQARQAEHLRRKLIDLYQSWGYQFVIPPLLEFTESLLVGLSSDVNLQTFKVTDQLSGRTMGICADITAQVARMDAHSLKQDGPSRLCYAGSVLHTRPKSIMASRSPIQVGAELYGDDSTASDIEIISLMLQTLVATGIEDITLDLGHVGIYRSLVSELGLDGDDERELFAALQRKSGADIEAVVKRLTGSAQQQDWLLGLSYLNGDMTVLDKAKGVLADAPNSVLAAIEELKQVANSIRLRMPSVSMYFDLSELRGFDYHTGLVFSALAPGHGQALANGGRYNHIGEAFGRARPATGFSTDLKSLLAYMPSNGDSDVCIYAPSDEDPSLWQVVQELRDLGEQVVSGLPEQPIPLSCNRQLVKSEGQWQVKPLT